MPSVPVTILVISFVKLRPVESISRINFCVVESVAYFGFDQAKETTTLLESPGAGVMLVAELVNTGAVPFHKKAAFPLCRRKRTSKQFLL